GATHGPAGATHGAAGATQNPAGATPLPAPLMLEGLASYKLASVDEFAAAGAWQKFLSAFGWQKTRSLQIEAEGVEVADLPLDQVLSTISKICRDQTSRLANPNFGLLQEGYAILGTYKDDIQRELLKSTDTSQIAVKDVTPVIYLLWKVYY